MGKIGSSAPRHPHVPVNLRINKQAAQYGVMPLISDHLRDKSDSHAGSDELHDEIELAAARSDRRFKASSSACDSDQATYRETGVEQDERFLL
jgi:hypothetical protein